MPTAPIAIARVPIRPISAVGRASKVASFKVVIVANRSQGRLQPA